MSEKPSFYRGFFEPESAANTDYQQEYRYNHTKETPRGHLFEMDDTPSRERIRLSHRSNTFIEMHPNGDMVHKVFGDGYEIIVKDKNVLVKGTCNITIEGDCNMYVKGDMVQTVDGNFEQHIKGHHTQFVEKTSKIISQGNMNISGGASAVGTVIIQAGDSLIIDTDCSVRGEVYGKKIASEGRIDAAGGISAGPAGFVTLTGGVAVGIPVAVPGKVLTISDVIAGGTVDAAVAVNAPLGTFATMSAILMTDEVNTNLYNAHIHPTSRGPSGPPTTKMV